MQMNINKPINYVYLQSFNSKKRLNCKKERPKCINKTLTINAFFNVFISFDSTKYKNSKK